MGVTEDGFERNNENQIVGNELGIETGQKGEEPTALRTRVKTLEQAFAKEIKDFATSTQILLNAQMTESRRTRERFMSHFRRDKLHNANDADYNIIREGKTSVHGGNALTGAYWKFWEADGWFCLELGF